MRYFLAKLPEFPPGMFASINQGFSPDCNPTSHGGDGRPFAKEAAKTRPVLTWDYSVTEGEGTVSPRCRVRRMFQQRRAEWEQGCYSGGICYTMAPKLNCLSIFCCAEAYWNPALKPDGVLADYGRLVFGDRAGGHRPALGRVRGHSRLGLLCSVPLFARAAARRAWPGCLPMLEGVSPESKPRLPLAPTMAEYRQSLLLLRRSFPAAGLRGLGPGAGPRPGESIRAGRRRSAAICSPWRNWRKSWPSRPISHSGRRYGKLVARLRQADVAALRKQYVATVYGIYDSGIPSPVDPRSSDATNNLFNLFHSDLALPAAPSALKPLLRATGKPYLWIGLGHAAGERGWTLSGWTVAGRRGRRDVAGQLRSARTPQPRRFPRPGLPLAGRSPDRRARRRTKNRGLERPG